MKKLMEVTPRIGLNIRTGPAISYRKLGAMPKGTRVTCTKEEGGWYWHEDYLGKGGWSCGEYLKLIKDYEPPETVPANPNGDSEGDGSNGNAEGPIEDGMYDYSEEEILGIFEHSNAKATDKFDELRVVHALPFQFTGETDTRPENCAYGRCFLDKIIGEGSFVYMTPGEPEFFPGANTRTRDGILSNITGSDEDKTELTSLLEGKAGRYYAFKQSYVEYMDYVNAMCRIAAVYLGINQTKGYDDATDYKNFDWNVKSEKGMFVGNNTSNPIYKDIHYQPCLCLYIDGNQTSYSDGISNSTDTSMLEGAINKGSEAIKEFRFAFGKGNVDDEAIMKTSKDNLEGVVTQVLSKMKLEKASSMAAQFSDYGETLVNGGNVIIPDVWRDSAYSKSYSIEVKLASPYGDPESIYLHVLVPLFHIMALAFPRQIGRSGYMSPFIVRAFSKAWFNCDMGIVESLQIKRASQEGWSVDGMPTEIDVSISLKDLYSVVAIGRTQDYSHLRNTEFLDMIGTMCGININKPDFDRKIALYKAYVENKVMDAGKGVFRRIEENIMNKINSLLK